MLPRRMTIATDPAALATMAIAAGVEAFGELDVEAAVIVRTIDEALASGVVAGQLQEFAAEVYLGAACGAGRPLAAAALDRTYVARVGEVLAGKRLPPHAVDEVRQTVRERLLAGRPPYVAGAVGRGALASLVAVIATRAAIDWLRANARGARQRADESAADGLVACGDPAHDHLRARYRAEVKAAFEGAVAGLEPRERTLLRFHLVDGLTIDEVATLYRIHRATVARQIDRARERVAAATRKLLSRTTDVRDRDLQELAALITSQLDLSLSRVLSSAAESR